MSDCQSPSLGSHAVGSTQCAQATSEAHARRSNTEQNNMVTACRMWRGARQPRGMHTAVHQSQDARHASHSAAQNSTCTPQTRTLQIGTSKATASVHACSVAILLACICQPQVPRAARRPCPHTAPCNECGNSNAWLAQQCCTRPLRANRRTPPDVLQGPNTVPAWQQETCSVLLARGASVHSCWVGLLHDA